MFWDNFVRLCNKKNEFPNPVAKKCGVKSTGTVTAWKNGAIPSDKYLSAIAEYLDVTKEELLADDSNVDNESSDIFLKIFSTKTKRDFLIECADIPEDKIKTLTEMVRAFKSNN